MIPGGVHQRELRGVRGGGGAGRLPEPGPEAHLPPRLPRVRRLRPRAGGEDSQPRQGGPAALLALLREVSTRLHIH